MTSPLIFGDWHGNSAYADTQLRRAHERFPDATRAIHCGDFGFWDTHIFKDQYTADIENGTLTDDLFPQGRRHLRGHVFEINETARELGITIYVVLGNHENYWEIDLTYGYNGFMVESEPYEVHTPNETITSAAVCFNSAMDTPAGITLDEDGFICSPLFSNIRITPRTHTWVWDGVRYASLSGATSIDVTSRVRGHSWWEQEMPRAEDVDALIEPVGDKDVDVLVTHDAPLEVSRGLYGHGKKLDKYIQAWAEISGTHVQRACDMFEPTLVVCGHHHMRLSHTLVSGTRVEILDRENAVEGNYELLEDLL